MELIPQVNAILNEIVDDVAPQSIERVEIDNQTLTVYFRWGRT